jgi:hypothetical protein
MKLVYRLLADLIVSVHFAYVTFVVLALVFTLVGGVLGWRWVRNTWFRLVHLAMITVVVAEAWCGAVCPLTRWENHFRTLAGEATYRGGFIANWLHEAIFFDAEPQVFTWAYSLFGLAVLAALIFIPPRGFPINRRHKFRNAAG